MPRPVIASVIVSYNPPEGFGTRVAAALEQTELAVVVDNASTAPPALPAADARIHLLRNDRNRGIAEALNQGVAQAEALGAEYALLLDHDSLLQPGAVAALCAAFDAPRQAVAAAVPRIRYAHPDIRCRWPQSNGGRSPFFRFVYAAEIRDPTPVDLAISSGMLIHIESFHRLGGFDGSLFIDLVDTDFCLRARRHGYRIVAVPQAELQHALGEVEKRMLLGVVPTFPTHHSASRHYTISRNRIILARRHAHRFPAWLAYETLGAAKLTLKVLLFEHERGDKLRGMLRGLHHGLQRALRDTGVPRRDT